MWRAIISISVSAILGACGPSTQSATDSAPLDRERVLGEFLATHWRLPIESQGAVPTAFSVAEADLNPQTCGACHPKQFAEWRTSIHAAAYSPGLSGQLIEGSLAQPLATRQCLTCHTPLAEQQPFEASGQKNGLLDASLPSHGVLCAGCHVRQHRRFGPPRRVDAIVSDQPAAHAGFEAREEFRESRFCAECHQFFNDEGYDGKPAEDTYGEWLRSPQAAAGTQCQDCHMPDRAHVWRGIHDPNMVRAALDVELFLEMESTELDAKLVLLNRAVGHAFPTYVTPRVYMAIYQVDSSGAEIPDSRVEAAIGREIDFADGHDVFDTRVLPKESVKIEYRRPREIDAVAIIGEVRVDPDFHYRGVYESLLATYTDPVARDQIADAKRRISASRYTLTEIRRELN